MKYDICKKIRSVWNETYARTTRKIYLIIRVYVFDLVRLHYIFNCIPRGNGRGIKSWVGIQKIKKVQQLS